MQNDILIFDNLQRHKNSPRSPRIICIRHRMFVHIRMNCCEGTFRNARQWLRNWFVSCGHRIWKEVFLIFIGLTFHWYRSSWKIAIVFTQHKWMTSTKWPISRFFRCCRRWYTTITIMHECPLRSQSLVQRVQIANGHLENISLFQFRWSLAVRYCHRILQ